MKALRKEILEDHKDFYTSIGAETTTNGASFSTQRTKTPSSGGRTSSSRENKNTSASTFLAAIENEIDIEDRKKVSEPVLKEDE